jgi:hypothetical protein
MLTGPQRTPDERGNLAELAGVYGAVTASCSTFNWCTVAMVYRIAGWDECPTARADVAVADAMALPIVDVSAP